MIRRLMIEYEGPFIPAAWVTAKGDWVNVRWPWNVLPGRVTRIAHEFEHLLESDFNGNEDHHPWWHFCGRSGVSFHSGHLSPRSLELARELLREGKVDA